MFTFFFDSKKIFFFEFNFFEGIILRQILIPNSSLTLCFEDLRAIPELPPYVKVFNLH